VFEMSFQAAAAQAVETFQVSGELQATQTGLPDFQGHIGFGLGPAREDGLRVFEWGIAGHVGRRQVVIQNTAVQPEPPAEVRTYATWSFVADGALRLGGSTLVEGEYFIGQLLGDYSGERKTNQEVFGNVLFRIAGGLRVGLELSWWATEWVDAPTATAFRVETAVLFAF